jgi:Rab GTPase-binding effector protein 1
MMENTEVHNGNQDGTENLHAKVMAQELEMKKMSDEFNLQRAKMKELFLAKEGMIKIDCPMLTLNVNFYDFYSAGECRKLVKELAITRKQLDEVKSELMIAEYSKEKDLEDQTRKAQEEIQSLQQLVHETIEQNSMSASEIKRLADENERYRLENHDLKESLAQVSLRILAK